MESGMRRGIREAFRRRTVGRKRGGEGERRRGEGYRRWRASSLWFVRRGGRRSTKDGLGRERDVRRVSEGEVGVGSCGLEQGLEDLRTLSWTSPTRTGPEERRDPQEVPSPPPGPLNREQEQVVVRPLHEGAQRPPA